MTERAGKAPTAPAPRGPGGYTELQAGDVIPVPPGYSSYTGAPYDDNPTALPETEEGGGEGEGGAAPTATSLNPATAVIGDPDVTLSVTGTGFVDGAVIVFNGGDETTTFVSETEVTTTVRPSTAVVAAAVPVSVRNPDSQVSGELSFTFTDV